VFGNKCCKPGKTPVTHDPPIGLTFASTLPTLFYVAGMFPCGRCCGVAFCAGVFFCSSIPRRQCTHPLLRNLHPSCHRQIPQLPGTSGKSRLKGCIGGGAPPSLPTEKAEGTSPGSENDGTDVIADDHSLPGGVQLPVPISRDSLSCSELEVGLQPNVFHRHSFLPAARLLCKGMLCVPTSCALIQKLR
jgi:hypothetical protein